MEMNNTEKRRSFIINFVYFVIILCLAYLFLEYVVTWIMPFIIGFLIALALRPLIGITARVTKFNKRFTSFIIVILCYGLLGFLLWRLGSYFVSETKMFFVNLPELYETRITPFFNKANRGLFDFARGFSPEFAKQIEQILSNFLESMQSYLIGFSANALSVLAGASAKLPFLLISLIFTVLSSLYISMDYDGVMKFFRLQIPEKKKAILIDIRSYLGRTLSGYLKAYCILMCLTFVELSVGFLALRVSNPFGIAAVTAIADALPVVGTGTVLLPWMVFSLFQQRFYLALGLGLLYLIITVVRHFVEPKIVGDQLGLPPILSLLCIYLGFVLFGVFGAILFPIIMNILLCLQKADKIHLWKWDKEDRPKGIILDMDGTMFDTEKISVEAMQKIAEQYGAAVSYDFALEFLGLPSEIVKKRFLEKFGSDFDFDNYRNDKIAYQNAIISDKGVPFKPGLVELLKFAKEAGVPCVVATSTSKERAMNLISKANLNEFFEAFVCGEDVEKGKPNPDIFLIAAEKIGVKPDECFVVEDSRNGILAASKTGAKAFLVPDLIIPDEEMLNAADVVCADLFEVLDYVKKGKC